MSETVPATLAKIPLQETRIFYERYANYKNLNNLLLTEIETARKEDKVGMPAGNAGCWRSMYKYKCAHFLYIIEYGNKMCFISYNMYKYKGCS